MSSSRYRAGFFGLVASTMILPWGGEASAQNTYSKRRINGVWVTGSFPRDEVDAELRRLRPRQPKQARRAVRAPQRAVIAPAANRAATQTAPAPDTASRSEAEVAAYYERLRQALERRVREILAEERRGAPPADKADQVSIELEVAPITETFDYLAGVKTTVLTGGVVVEEPIGGPKLGGTDKTVPNG